MPYYVYILTNKSNTLYVGVTNNLERRIYEHSTKKNHFTNKYNINKLIYYKEFIQALDAIRVEKKIKGWARKKKMAFINFRGLKVRGLLLSSLQKQQKTLPYFSTELSAEDCNHFSIHPRFKKAGFSASDYKNN